MRFGTSLVGLLGVALIGGCNAILGIGDHELATDGGMAPVVTDDSGSDGALPPPPGPGPDASSPPDADPDASPPPGPDASVAQLSVAGATLDFGTVTVGQTLTPGTIVVSNHGTGTSAALTTAISGAPYSVVTDGCNGVALAAGATCQVEIALDDGVMGTPTGTFTITDTSTDAVTVALTANILTPGALSITPQSQDFKSWVTGASSPSQTFTVSNTGLTVTGAISVALTPTNGATAAEFPLVDGCTGKTLAANASCTVSTLLKPATPGPKSASLVINATPGGPATASLTGTGLAPAALSISPTSFPFPTTAVGTGPTETFVISNTGGVASATLTTALTYGTGTASTEFVITADQCNGKPLAGGSSCNVTVRFDPATFGAKSAALRINGGALTATMTATGEDFLTLTVTETGSGGGIVNGDQISCPSTCSEQVARTTVTPTVTLTASPNSASLFSGWSGGGCSGTGACVVTMSHAQAVTARFDPKVVVTVDVHTLTGQSTTITSSPPGINCTGANCNQSATFASGSSVTLTLSGVTTGLVGWSTGCTGTTCTFTASGTQTIYVTATANNIVFVTSGTTNGALGLGGADAMCATYAKNGGLPGKYVAFLNTTTTDAFSRLGSARGWIRPDGLPFGDTVASIQGNTTYYPPNLTETAGLARAEPWTGYSYPGGPVYSCRDGTPPATTVEGWVGASPSGSTAWANQAVGYCNATFPIYCFGTDFVSAVSVPPPPAGSRIVFITANTYPVAGIPAADTACQTEAQAAGLASPGSFLALLTTSLAGASSRFNLAGPNWFRPDHVALATSPTNFMNDTLIAAITVQANGVEMPSGYPYAWLGGFANTAAQSPADTCNDWSTTSSSSNGEVALPSGPYFPSSIQDCSMKELFICVQN